MPPAPRFPDDARSLASQGNGAPLRPRQPLDPAVDGRHLKELLGVLRRSWWLVLAVTAGIFAISAYLAFSARPTYQAHAVIRLADVRRSYTGGFDDYSTQAPLGRTTNLITSELEVLLGRAVLGEVVDREGLRLMVAPRSDLPSEQLTDVRVPVDAPPAELRLRFGPRDYVVRGPGGDVGAAYGSAVDVDGLRFTVRAAPRAERAELLVLSREEAIDYLAASLQVVPRGNTNAISVRYTSTDPHHARKVVNAAVEVFRDYNARSARQQAELRREFLEEQLRKNDGQLAEAQQAFGAFQAREQVYSSGDRLSAQEQDLMALAMRREEMDANRRMYASLLAALESSSVEDRAQVLGTLVSAADIASNPVVYQLYTQRAEYEIELDSLTTGALGSTAEHPDVQKLRSLIESTETRLIAAVQSHMDAMEARIAALDELRERSAAQMRRLPEAHAEELRLTQQLEALGRTRDKLIAELHEARMAEAVEMGQVEIVYLAPLPIRPSSAGPARTLGVGLVLGLIFGCVVAFARETLDTTLRSHEDVEDALRLTVLAVVPPLDPSRGPLRRLRRATAPATGSPGPPGSALDRTPGPAAIEAYRVLRSNLVFARTGQTLKRLVVTSAVAGEGKTTTAANLALTFAQQGTRVLLVDCVFREPVIHEAFHTPQAPGLMDALVDGRPLDEAVRPTAYEGLFLLTAGSAAGSRGTPNEQRVADSLDRLAREFDLLILDTPQVLDSADAVLIGRLADGCILVVRAGETERGLAQQAQRQLALVQARLVGAVLNDPTGVSKKYGYPGRPSPPYLARRVRKGPAPVTSGGPSTPSRP